MMYDCRFVPPFPGVSLMCYQLVPLPTSRMEGHYRSAAPGTQLVRAAHLGTEQVFSPHLSFLTCQTDIADFTRTARLQLHAAIKISESKISSVRLGCGPGSFTVGVDEAGR